MDEETPPGATAIPEIVSLPLYPHPLPDSAMQRIREAKGTLESAPLVRAVAATPGCGRVLAWGEPPPWVCDYCLVDDTTSAENLATAISVTMGLTDDPRMRTMAHSLSRMLGRGVREV